jgi:hypothetical protein
MTQAASNISCDSRNAVTRRAALTGAAAFAVAVPSAAIALPVQSAGNEYDYDPVATLKRAEEIIFRLQTRYIREAWSPDTEGGERMLRYFRREIAEPGYDDAEEFTKAVVAFIGRNNQSLDWLLMGHPGSMICSLAAMSGQAARQVDPVFAAIEKHRKLEAAYVTACNAPDDEDWDGEVEYFGTEAHAALGALVSMTPTTLQGASAALRHIEEYAQSYDNEGALFANASEVVSTPAQDFLSRVAKSLEASAGQS